MNNLETDKEYLKEYNKEYYQRIRKYNNSYKDYQRINQQLHKKDKKTKSINIPIIIKTKVKSPVYIKIEFDDLIVEI